MCQNKIFIEYIYFVSVELWEDSEVLLCCTCWGHFTFSLGWRQWKFEVSQFCKKKSLKRTWIEIEHKHSLLLALQEQEQNHLNPQGVDSCLYQTQPSFVCGMIWNSTADWWVSLSKDARGELWLSWCTQRRQSPGIGFFASLFLERRKSVRQWRMETLTPWPASSKY